MMTDLMREAIDRFSLLSGVRTVTVACSGGADSVALLDALAKQADALKITVRAAHFNHAIRGAEADRDEEFVRSFCLARGIPFFCGRGDVPAYAREHRISMELAARELRYAYLAQFCAEDAVVATAHTATDNAETLLFRLTRGTALHGLCGIPPKRDGLIRPLLLCTRAQVEEYCAENGLTYMEDSTNRSDDYARNRLRHHVLPELMKLNPAAVTAIQRTVLSLREDEALLQELARAEYETRLTDGALRNDGADTLSPAISKRMLRMLYAGATGGKTPDALHLNGLDGLFRHGGAMGLPGNLRAECRGGMLRIFPAETEETSEFSVEIVEKKNDFTDLQRNVNNLFLKNALDRDKIVGNPVLRTRQPGDTIRLAGSNGTKTLKKLYNEKKIPGAVRDTLPVLADDEGVIWICGIGAAERCAADRFSGNILEINVKTESFKGML